MVEWKKLGEVCEKTSNIKWKDQAEDIIYKYIDLSSVSIDSHKIILTTEICKQNAPSRAQQVVNYNDILLGTTRPTLKRYCQVPSYLDNNICSTGFCIFRANKKYVLSRWLYHNIGSGKFWDYCELKQQGAGYPCLSNSDAFAYVIPVPSLSEQQQIVEQLDTFTASIENLKEQIAQRRKQYEYYRDQLLDLKGKEGVEMKKLLDVLAQPITDGPHETPSFYEYGIPFISADAIVDNEINFSRKRGYISEEYDLLCQKKYKPQLNDIYLVKSGSTTGKVAIVRTEKRFNIWSPLAAIRVNQSNHPYFVYYMLQTKNVQDQVKLKSSQGSQPNLSMRVLENFVIPVPSFSEQQRIVSILDTFEASVRNLEQQLTQREKQYEYYRNKLLRFE